MPENIAEPFGGLLKQLRLRQRLTQQQLANSVGVHRNTIGRWEEGSYLPDSKAQVLELARYLHLEESEARQLLDASLLSPTPYWSVPYPRNPFFTGREKILQMLHQVLDAQQTAVLTQSYALHGLGGIGKTQLAIEYAYRHSLEYTAVFWIGADTTEQIIASLLRIAEALQLPVREDKDQQRVIDAVQRWLSIHRQWLLIWDNLEELDLLDHFLPTTRSGALLITTRRQALGTRARSLNLLPMNSEEGLLFLLRRAKLLAPDATGEHLPHLAVCNPGEYAAAEELVSTLGGLPLALDQAGAYIEEIGCSVSDYLNRYEQQRAQLLARRGLSGRDHPHAVSATFTLAMQRVEREQPAAADLLRVCALLHAEGIPEELFREGGAYLGSHLQALARDPVQLDQALALLRSLSLVQRQPEEHTLSLHRLVQVVLQESMSEQERELWTRHTLVALDALFPEVTYDVWRQCERLLPHVLACMSTFSDCEGLTELLRKAADYLRERAQYKQAEWLYQRATAIGEQVRETEHSDLAPLLGGLAILYTEQGKYEQAEVCYLQALDIRKQTFGSEHPEVANLLSGLAMLSYKQGKYEQAESLHQQALHIREQALGSEHPLIAHSLYGLAYLYARQGKYEQAEPLYQRALHIREQVLGPVHPDLATSQNGLAILYQDQGKYEQAETLFQSVLHIYEQTLRPGHPQIAAPLYSLAIISDQQGKLEQAEAFYQRALHIWEQALGTEHPNIASPLNGLAVLYMSQGKLEQAELSVKRALHIWEQALGSTHPNVGYPLDTLATLYHQQGKYEQAEPLYQRALHIWEQAFGPEHPAMASSLNGLANLSSQKGKYQQAELLYRQALHIREQHLGQEHPETAETLYDLAIFQQKQGNRSEAISFAERALSIRFQSLGDTHPKTIATRALYERLLRARASSHDEA